jgi:hypothetical protein
MVLRMIAMEHEVTEVGEIVRQGRAMHRAWVERVLSTFLEERAGAERRRRLAMLVAVTDVLTWKVLRQEQGLSQRAYERSVRELLEALQ